MSDLNTINYVHTLLVCEFNVGYQVAIIIRKNLQKDHNELLLLEQWIRHKAQKIDLPKFNDTGPFFDDKHDKHQYATRKKITSHFPYRGIRYLDIFASPHTVSIYIQGQENTYELLFNPYYAAVYMERREFMDPEKRIVVCISEESFHQKVDEFFTLILSTNKIPFDFYNVK